MTAYTRAATGPALATSWVIPLALLLWSGSAAAETPSRTELTLGAGLAATYLTDNEGGATVGPNLVVEGGHTFADSALHLGARVARMPFEDDFRDTTLGVTIGFDVTPGPLLIRPHLLAGAYVHSHLDDYGGDSRTHAFGALGVAGGLRLPPLIVLLTPRFHLTADSGHVLRSSLDLTLGVEL